MRSYCEALRISCAVATATSESRPSALSMINFVFSGATLKREDCFVRAHFPPLLQRFPPSLSLLFTFAATLPSLSLLPPSLPPLGAVARSLARRAGVVRARVWPHTPPGWPQVSYAPSLLSALPLLHHGCPRYLGNRCIRGGFCPKAARIKAIDQEARGDES